jgi:RimJ/RimL family protein N-acetyltransferase
MTRIAPLPVRLTAADRAAVADHFLALDADDRRLRFGASLSDEAVRDLEERIDFGRDEIFGVPGDDLRLLGVVHVAFYPGRAELGLSVLPEARGQGVGAALFSRAVMHLTNRGVREVFVHCVRENGAMMRLARRNGMRLVAEGGEADGYLELPRPTVGSIFVEWIWDQNAQLVQAARRQAQALRYLSQPLARKA